MAEKEARDLAPRIELGVLFETVSIEIVCSSDYAAQVMFDDLVDRLKRGETISIGKNAPGPAVGG